MAAILTFLLAIIAFADPRRNHWQKAKSDSSSILVFNANIASFLINAQVSVIYFQAATAKFKVEEWVNGTAMYYWMNSPYFGATGLFKTVVDPLLTIGFVAVITWLPLILEMALAFSFLMDLRIKRILLVLGITFHLMIAMLMGIGSFSIIMTAALILLLSPLDVKSFAEFYSSGIWAKLRILDRIRFT
ncbi:HTTM domain-containing protein [Deinococcus indicus]|uniref:HTTM domain-containing protein n=1 Tax=Deinococcus indicus TaxID=223556 RepID=UPI001554946B|nr:HTTM domain-containing protein [Deinococcus indicus]